MTAGVRVVLALGLGLILSACEPSPPGPQQKGDGETSSSVPSAGASPKAGIEPVAGSWFRDRTPQSGVDFVHESGFSGRRYIYETLGPGCAVIDHDQDGDLDLFFVDGESIAGDPSPTSGSRLFRNDGDLRFKDVTDSASARARGYGFGAAIGDVDDDGDDDIYVTRFGSNALLVNDGSGRFSIAEDARGARAHGLSFSASFVDLDRDGHLDLYVTQYVEFSHENHRPCRLGDEEVFCAPRQYPAERDYFFRNTGRDFVDRSMGIGLERAPAGAGLGVVAGYIDDDALIDLYVANDGHANHLWIQKSADAIDLQDEALLFGCALGESGKAEAGMGVDIGDFDADADFDLVCTNLEAQTNAIYVNDENLVAVESSFPLGMGASSLSRVGFGIRLADFDLDGDLDEFVANGHILDNIESVRPGSTHAQTDLVLENRLNDDGSRRFHEIHGADTTHPWPIGVGRALVTADLDNDGDLDVVITNWAAAPVLLENVVGDSRSKTGVQLVGTSAAANRSTRNTYGARVRFRAGSTTLARTIGADGSYLSSRDPRELFPLAVGATGTVEISWPSGVEQTVEVTPGAYYRIVEGSADVERRPFES